MSRATLQNNSLMPTRLVRCITVMVPCEFCKNLTQQQPFGAYFGCICRDCSTELEIQYQIWCYEQKEQQQTYFGPDSQGSFKNFASQLNIQKIKENVEKYRVPINSKNIILKD